MDGVDWRDGGEDRQMGKEKGGCKVRERDRGR